MKRLDGEAGTPSVDDHPFRAPLGRPWDRCSAQGCGLSEAAHTGTVPGGSYAEHLAAHPPAGAAAHSAPARQGAGRLPGVRQGLAVSGGRWVWMPDGPATFPGAGWYSPTVQSGASVTLLPLPADEAELERLRALEAERRARPFGFARALEP